MSNNRGTSPVVIGNDFHTAMDLLFKQKRVNKRYQVEIALIEYFRRESPEIFEAVLNSKKQLIHTLED